MKKSSKLYKNKTNKIRKMTQMTGGFFKKKKTVLVEPSHLQIVEGKSINNAKYSIKQSNINKIMNKTKSQNDTMVNNISLIGNEIDNLKAEVKDNKYHNNKIYAIIKYLDTHIQELTIARAKLLYNNNDNEAREREQKKKSFFNKFKKNTVKNTPIQIRNKQNYYRLLLETNFIIKIIKEINNVNEKVDIFNDFITFLETNDNKNNYTIEELKKETDKIEKKYKGKDNEINFINNNISIIDNEIKIMRTERTKINTNNYKTINKIGISSKEIYSTIIKYLSKLNDNMKDNMPMPNKGDVLDHTFISKIITDKKINADKDKKLVLLFKFIEFIEHAKDQKSLNEIHDIKVFEKETDKMINKYIYDIDQIDTININKKIQPKHYTKTNTQMIENEKQRKQRQELANIRKNTKKILSNRNEERYQQAMKEQNQSQKNSSEALMKKGQSQLNLVKQLNSRDGIIQMKEINLSKMNKKILTKEFLRKLFISILGNNSIKTINLSGSLNTKNFDDTILKLLLKYIEDNTTIEELNISKCNLNYKDFNKIVDAMIKNLNLHDNEFKMSKLIFNNNNIIPYSTFSNKINNNTMRDFNTTLQNLMIKFESLKTVSFSKCYINNDFLKQITRWLPNTSIKEFDLSFNDKHNGGSINDTDIIELVKILKEDDKYKNTDDIIIIFRDYFDISNDAITDTNSIKIHNITIITNDDTIETIKNELNL
jgi:hypothetical protein